MGYLGPNLCFPAKACQCLVGPGDSLHVAVEEGFFASSYSFSGSNADNSRFTSEWIPQFYSLRLDRDAYKGLGVEDFKRLMEQWRRDQFEFLAEGREQYALSSGCIDYVTDYVNYEWAIRMVDYPSRYRFANGRENRDMVALALAHKVRLLLAAPRGAFSCEVI